MKIIGRSLLLFFLSFSAYAFQYEGKYIKNYDGDTITISIEIWPGLYKVTGMRLFGIDSPEINGKCEKEKKLAREAKEFVASLVSQPSKLIVSVVGFGKFGRPLIVLFADDKNVSKELVSMGYARHYDGVKREDWCNEN